MHTRQLAAQAGVNPQTLRYYERRGLLSDPPRSAAGYRLYPDEAVTTVRCAANFWRCRHVHCVITGAGWLALALFAFAAAILGISAVAGYMQALFFGILALGLVVETAWYATHCRQTVSALSTST